MGRLEVLGERKHVREGWQWQGQQEKWLFQLTCILSIETLTGSTTRNSSQDSDNGAYSASSREPFSTVSSQDSDNGVSSAWNLRTGCGKGNRGGGAKRPQALPHQEHYSSSVFSFKAICIYVCNRMYTRQDTITAVFNCDGGSPFKSSRTVDTVEAILIATWYI